MHILSHHLVSSLCCLIPLVAAVSPQCDVYYDGRVPASANTSQFEQPNTTPFDNKLPSANSPPWPKVLSFPPATSPSRFDLPSGKPIDIAVLDSSHNQQSTGKALHTSLTFRENTDDEHDLTNRGTKTFHWSTRQTWWREPLDLARHEYTMAWHARSPGREGHFRLVAGRLNDPAAYETWGNRSVLPPEWWKVLDARGAIVFAVAMEKDEWQNFAVTLNFGDRQMRVHYSKGDAPLEAVTPVLRDHDEAGGRFSVGLFKYPAGIRSSWDLYSGVQEPLSDGVESVLFGGVFVENSWSGCISR